MTPHKLFGQTVTIKIDREEGMGDEATLNAQAKAELLGLISRHPELILRSGTVAGMAAPGGTATFDIERLFPTTQLFSVQLYGLSVAEMEEIYLYLKPYLTSRDASQNQKPH